MISDGKTRINVTLSDEILSRIETYAKAMGINRSALCCYMIGQQIMAMDKALGIADAVSSKLQEVIGESDVLKSLKPADENG